MSDADEITRDEPQPSSERQEGAASAASLCHCGIIIGYHCMGKTGDLVFG